MFSLASPGRTIVHSVDSMIGLVWINPSPLRRTFTRKPKSEPGNAPSQRNVIREAVTSAAPGGLSSRGAETTGARVGRADGVTVG